MSICSMGTPEIGSRMRLDGWKLSGGACRFRRARRKLSDWTPLPRPFPGALRRDTLPPCSARPTLLMVMIAVSPLRARPAAAMSPLGHALVAAAAAGGRARRGSAPTRPTCSSSPGTRGSAPTSSAARWPPISSAAAATSTSRSSRTAGVPAALAQALLRAAKTPEERAVRHGLDHPPRRRPHPAPVHGGPRPRSRHPVAEPRLVRGRRSTWWWPAGRPT